MKLLTRKNGIWIGVIGIVIFLFNFITLTLWDIDIDILGAVIFILGLVIAIACGKSMKHSSGGLTRKNGVWLCIIAVMIILITGYMPFINSDISGGFGAIVFLLGIILIAVRWNH
ncbi:MAG: hypothetical protein PHH54_03870 [Candidatus Nanoarchaeia archaeon]|nr:hypothetical protein [Candidatus Nanoarchaeia archaeon]MDD5741097.1 hypothetical protein [Candidatus Nanoarchaeia archaeon]